MLILPFSRYQQYGINCYLCNMRYIKNFLTGFAAIGILVAFALAFVVFVFWDYTIIAHAQIILFAIGMSIVGGLAYLATDGR